MNNDELQLPIPFPVGHGADQEQGPLADLAAAAAAIQVQIIDLERDYGTRDREFWQTTLDMLAVLRQALQPFLDLVRNGKPRLKRYIPIKNGYRLSVEVYLLDERIDKVGIALTAYMPACSRVTRERLEERHSLLKQLRELMKTIQDLRDDVLQEGNQL